MLERRAMWPIDILLGLLVFIGVSSSISPWFHDLYSGIAWPWGVGAGVIAVAIWAVFRFFAPDLELESEIWAADRQNGRMVQLLATAATDPEAAKELAARRVRMEQQRLRRRAALDPPAPTQG